MSPRAGLTPRPGDLRGAHVSVAPSFDLPVPSAGSSPPVFGVLSTYLPTPCGLATFSAALSKGLVALGAEARVVRIADGSVSTEGNVVGELVNGSPSSLRNAADLLNECDVAVVQHEYGLYGGPDGDDVVQVLDALEVPSIVVAHTILLHPTPHQRSVLVDVVAAAGQVVVMSQSARDRLCGSFDVDPAKVVTIPHGAATPTPVSPPTGRPTLLTWGLLGPGKGVERVIDAL